MNDLARLPLAKERDVRVQEKLRRELGPAICALLSEPDYLLFTDADIVYDPGALTRLVSRSQANGLVLNSLMVALRCESFAERARVHLERLKQDLTRALAGLCARTAREVLPRAVEPLALEIARWRLRLGTALGSIGSRQRRRPGD